MLLKDDTRYRVTKTPTTTGAGSRPPQSVVEAFIETWRRYPQRTVLHATIEGQAQSWSASALMRRIAEVAAGLQALGFERGTPVGILAAPSPTWLIVDCAVQALGGISVPLFPNAHPETLAHIARHAGLGWCLVCGADAAEAAEPILDHVDRVVGHRVPDLLGAYPLSHLMSRAGADAPDRLRTQLAARHPAETATIIYTSGSTGQPKGVVLSHGNLLSQMAAARAVFPLDPARDRALSALPWAHVFERMVTATYLWQGIPLAIADNVRRLGEDLRRVQPTVITVVPRLLEKLRERIHAAADELAGLRGTIARRAMALADSRHGPLPPLRGVLDALVYRGVRRRLGGRLRTVICGGAALAPRVETFFHHIGIDVQSGYGLTEAGPVVAVNHRAAHRCGSVGRAFPGVEIRIASDGEILARSVGVMRGYHRDPEATRSIIDPDGWLHTGDLGSFDADGFLSITGRSKELMKTAYGKYVAPVPIEQLLCADPLVDQAMVIADGRPYVSALLFIDPLSAAHDGSDADRIAALIDACNARLDRWSRIRRWRVVAQPPSVANGLLTPTLKLRRAAVLAYHADLVDALYADPPAQEDAPCANA